MVGAEGFQVGLNLGTTSVTAQLGDEWDNVLNVLSKAGKFCGGERLLALRLTVVEGSKVSAAE